MCRVGANTPAPCLGGDGDDGCAQIQHPIKLRIGHDNFTKVLLCGKETYELKWSVESIANFSIGAGYPCRKTGASQH